MDASLIDVGGLDVGDLQSLGDAVLGDLLLPVLDGSRAQAVDRPRPDWDSFV